MEEDSCAVKMEYGPRLGNNRMINTEMARVSNGGMGRDGSFTTPLSTRRALSTSGDVAIETNRQGAFAKSTTKNDIICQDMYHIGRCKMRKPYHGSRGTQVPVTELSVCCGTASPVLSPDPEAYCCITFTERKTKLKILCDNRQQTTSLRAVATATVIRPLEAVERSFHGVNRIHDCRWHRCPCI